MTDFFCLGILSSCRRILSCNYQPARLMTLPHPPSSHHPLCTPLVTLIVRLNISYHTSPFWVVSTSSAHQTHLQRFPRMSLFLGHS